MFKVPFIMADEELRGNPNKMVDEGQVPVEEGIQHMSLAENSDADSVTVTVHPLSTKPDECWKSMKESKVIKKVKPLSLDSEKAANSIRFVCISDTHSYESKLEGKMPDGDVLIHAGDFTGAGDVDEVVAFNEFLGSLKDKYKHILVIAGNHEVSFDGIRHGLSGAAAKLYFWKSPFKYTPEASNMKDLLTNCTYLEDSSIELYGIKIYGSPWQPPHFNLAFNLPRGDPLLQKWNSIPKDTDILITHGPPLGYGDFIARGNHVGCAELLSTIQDRVKPKYHICGHIHESYGILTDNVTTFINAASCNKRYQLVNRPIIFDVPLVDLPTASASL